MALKQTPAHTPPEDSIAALSSLVFINGCYVTRGVGRWETRLEMFLGVRLYNSYTAGGLCCNHTFAYLYHRLVRHERCGKGTNNPGVLPLYTSKRVTIITPSAITNGGLCCNLIILCPY